MTPDERSAAIAARTREARENAGLSQGQAAKLLKMSRPSITELELGNRKVSAVELAEMAALYGVTVGWLACETLDSNNTQDSIRHAAREIASLKKEDLDAVLHLVRSIQTNPTKR